jgi:hypothetical protein
MNDSTDVQLQLLQLAEGLIRYRFDLARLVFGLESSEQDQPEEAALRADLECAIVDHFDPLLKTILKAAGGLRGALLETALDLAGIRHRLQCFREGLPCSQDEDDMFDGKIPADVPTEMKITLAAVIEDQLDLAYENLLYAVGYSAPEPAPENQGELKGERLLARENPHATRAYMVRRSGTDSEERHQS